MTLLVPVLCIVYYFMSMGKNATTAAHGYLSVVLHAHLPYIRYPEHERHLEERWLYEAMTETYIPLLDVFDSLLNDRVDFYITLSLTPTLIEMLQDDLLMKRYESYIEDLLELAEKEVFRTRRDKDFGPLARMYLSRFSRIQHLFGKTYRKDLLSSFRTLADSGRVRVIASAATHAYLPALMTSPVAAEAQISIGIDHHGKTFGKHPGGFWLPECGFVPELDGILKENGVTFFFLDSHGLLNARPRHRFSIYAPLRTPSGIVAFSRDVESSKQIWSSIEGYPGDYDYRDFYRDIGFDLDIEYVGPYLPGGVRTFTGLKYYRITGGSERKKPYIPGKALKKARIHAGHFVESKNRQITALSEKLGIRPVITLAFDAELFGHWWFEGPEWLNYFLREGPRGKNSFTFIDPAEYIRQHRDLETAMPSASSWGDRGYSHTWIHPSNRWIYRHLNRAAKLHAENCRNHLHARGILRRALNQSSRELLLAQASDWAFMMKSGNSSEFAQKKIQEHLRNFFALHEDIVSGRINRSGLLRLERKNNIFRSIDFRIFGETEGMLS